MSLNKIKLILIIPMFSLASMIFNEVVNNEYDIQYKIIYSIFGLFFIFDSIRIIRTKKK